MLAGLLLLAAPAVLIPASAASSPAPIAPAAQVTGLIAALRARAATLPEADEEWKSLRPEIDRLLGLADGEVAAGRLYTALERLADANRYVGGTAFRVAHPEMVASLDRFTEGWSAADRELTRDESGWSAATWKRTPAAVRGVAEIEYGQARHLYRASRDYAVADSPASGTHYVGEALAAMAFARSVQGLGFEKAPGTFAARSYAAEIAALDARVVAAYRPPRSIDSHTDFIRIDGTLKMAAELDAAGLHHGALVAWLRAVRLYGALEAGWSGAPARPTDTLRAEAAALPERLKGPGDGSIAIFLKEQAEGAIERSAAPETAALYLAAADAVLARAVPAWAEARDRRPAPAATGKDQVRVTLVRWPYT